MLVHLSEKFTIDEVLNREPDNKIYIDNYKVNFCKTNRIKLYYNHYHKYKEIKCAKCALVANTFYVDCTRFAFNMHLNLYYTSKNIEILFTQDHIISKNNDGDNYISNLQPMCLVCNQLKGKN